MHVKNPAYTCASRKSSRSVLAISALVVFSAAALLVGLQHPTVALAKDGGSGGGNGLASLKTVAVPRPTNLARFIKDRSEEHTSELQSLGYLVCRLLLEKKKRTQQNITS